MTTRLLRAANLLAPIAALTLLAGCPAYTISGLGGNTGREVFAVKAAEPEAKLRCEREDCPAIEVARPYTIERSLPAFLLFSGVELAGAGICAANAADVSSLNNSTRTALVAGAGAVALGLFVLDVVTALQNKQQFSKRIEPPRFTKKFASASWSGLTVPLSLDDIVATGTTEVPASFSVRDAAERRGLQAGQRRLGPSAGKLAVLDFKAAKGSDVTIDQIRYLSDVVRSAALKAAPQLDVITRENLMVLLEAGMDLAACEGECEVDTGRKIGADVVVSGDIIKIGSQLKLNIRLHETKDGRLLGSEQASGANVEELDGALGGASSRLLGGLKGGG